MGLARKSFGMWLAAAWLLGCGLTAGRADGPCCMPIVPPAILELPCGPGPVCLPPLPPPLPPPCPIDPPVPIVTVKVRVPACTPPGQDIEYRICVENCSPGDAHHVVIKN